MNILLSIEILVDVESVEDDADIGKLRDRVETLLGVHLRNFTFDLPDTTAEIQSVLFV